MKFQNFKKSMQSGFTLIELIVVIVILGILAAVAIPKLTGQADNAREAVELSTLGALKAGWGLAFANKKSEPTLAEVVAQMDPVCVVTTSPDFTCPGVFQKTNGTTLAVFTATLTGGLVMSPSVITIKTP